MKALFWASYLLKDKLTYMMLLCEYYGTGTSEKRESNTFETTAQLVWFGWVLSISSG